MLRVMQVGLGPIGMALAARAVREPAMELVGAADADPSIAGRDLGSLLGGDPRGLTVGADAVALFGALRPDVVLQATGSFLEDVAPQLSALLEGGASIVSTCEELAYPFYRHPRLAERLDECARRSDAVLLGSGVNPGFVMDKFVITLMAASETFRSVQVSRIVDASTRRGPFQKKIGAGLSRAEFERSAAGGRMGHIGLVESAHMLADAMGVAREREVARELSPVMAEQARETEHVRVEAGAVAGLYETVAIQAAGDERVRMELEMAIGASGAHDTVTLDGTPPIRVEIGSGVAGDEGTVAVVLSCAPLLAGLEPGLRTMLDVPLAPPTAPRGILRSGPLGT